MIEELNNWVMIIASWITLIQCLVKLARKYLPKIRESLKRKRWRRIKH